MGYVQRTPSGACRCEHGRAAHHVALDRRGEYQIWACAADQCVPLFSRVVV